MYKPDPYRKYARVEDRPEKCEINPSFGHYCSKHKQRACSNPKPPHCAGEGSLTNAPFNVQVNVAKPKPISYGIKHTKEYCEECLGLVSKAYWALEGYNRSICSDVSIVKCSPAEIEIMKQLDLAEAARKTD